MYENAGIYKIENLINGKIYIGSSVDLKNRWRQHLQYFVNDKHGNRYLQRAWNKYGAENFRFSVIELCEKDMLLVREQYFIDIFDACQSGYNLSPTAGSNLGRILSEEARKNISIRQTGRKLGPHSEEHKQKLSLAGTGIKKRHRTEEEKKRMSLLMKGKPQPFNCKPSPFKGIPGHSHTEDTKRRISESMKKLRAKQRNLRLVDTEMIRSMM